MNDNDYREQFTHEVKASLREPTTTKKKIPGIALGIMIMLVGVAIIELIVIVLGFMGSFSTPIDFITEENDVGDYYSDNDKYAFNSDGDIIGVELSCFNDAGESYSLSRRRTYTLTDASNQVVESGEYELINGNIVKLLDKDDQVLFYDGMVLADGIVLFDCEGYQGE